MLRYHQHLQGFPSLSNLMKHYGFCIYFYEGTELHFLCSSHGDIVSLFRILPIASLLPIFFFLFCVLDVFYLKSCLGSRVGVINSEDITHHTPQSQHYKDAATHKTVWWYQSWVTASREKAYTQCTQ